MAQLSTARLRYSSKVGHNNAVNIASLQILTQGWLGKKFTVRVDHKTEIAETIWKCFALKIAF